MSNYINWVDATCNARLQRINIERSEEKKPEIKLVANPVLHWTRQAKEIENSIFNYGTFNTFDRIDTIGDGNCLIHAMLTLTSDKYRRIPCTTNDQLNRINISTFFRTKLISQMCSDPDPAVRKTLDGQVGVFTEKETRLLLTDKTYLSDDMVPKIAYAFDCNVILLVEQYVQEKEGGRIIPIGEVRFYKERNDSKGKPLPYMVIRHIGVVDSGIHYEAVWNKRTFLLSPDEAQQLRIESGIEQAVKRSHKPRGMFSRISPRRKSPKKFRFGNELPSVSRPPSIVKPILLQSRPAMVESCICKAILQSGSNKGQKCGRPCIENTNSCGIPSHKQLSLSASVASQELAQPLPSIIVQPKPQVKCTCKAILKSGPNEGQECGRPCIENTNSCGIPSHKQQK